MYRDGKVRKCSVCGENIIDCKCKFDKVEEDNNNQEEKTEDK